MKDINVNEIIPEEKDYERAEGLKFRHGSKEVRESGYPWESSGEAMAKAIKDPVKLVRRAKAVVATYGIYYGDDNDFIWRPFYKALFAMGFSLDDVKRIQNFSKKA